MKELIQKRGINYRKYILFSDRIHVFTRDSQKTTSYSVRLDEIGYNKYYVSGSKTKGARGIIIIGILLFCLTLIQIFDKHPDTSVMLRLVVIYLVMFAIVAVLIYTKPAQDDIFLVGGKKNIVFYRKIPNETEVLIFMEELINARKQYLRNRSASFDQYTREPELLLRLSCLKSRNIISNEEFDVILEDFKTSRLL